MKKYLELMENAMNAGALVEVYMDREDTQRFCVGYVLAMDDEYFAMKCVDKYGDYDGYFVKKMDLVYMVCEGTRYLENIERLYVPQETQFKPEVDADLRVQMLEFAEKQGCVVDIELLESGEYDMTGFVEIAEEGVVVHGVDKNGYPDGRIAFSLDDITEICCDDCDDRRLQRLAKIRAAE